MIVYGNILKGNIKFTVARFVIGALAVEIECPLVQILDLYSIGPCFFAWTGSMQHKWVKINVI